MGRPNFIDPIDPVYSGMVYDELDAARKDITSYLGMRDLEADRVDLRRTRTGADLCLENADVDDLYAWALDVGGTLDLRHSSTGDCFLRSASAADGIDGRSMVVDQRLDLGQVEAPYADLRGAAITDLYLEAVDLPVLDLRGAHIWDLVVDDADRYEIRVDEKTRLYSVQNGVYGIRDVATLTEHEEQVLEALPATGQPFTAEDVQYAVDDTQETMGTFGSLVRKEAVLPLDDRHYCINSDHL